MISNINKVRELSAGVRARLVIMLVIVICVHCNENKNNDRILVDYFASTGKILKKQFT